MQTGPKGKKKPPSISILPDEGEEKRREPEHPFILMEASIRIQHPGEVRKGKSLRVGILLAAFDRKKGGGERSIRLQLSRNSPRNQISASPGEERRRKKCSESGRTVPGRGERKRKEEVHLTTALSRRIYPGSDGREGRATQGEMVNKEGNRTNSRSRREKGVLLTERKEEVSAIQLEKLNRGG